jgi:peroxiredoxin
MSPRIFLLNVLLCPAISFADDVPAVGGKPGHSTHGEAFDEGPRQAAVLMRGMGNVSFPITAANADAQKFFDQGIAQLHGFWYYEAERSFRQAAKLDDTAPMPYVGMALANVNNEKRPVEFMKQAVSRRAKATPREQLYIDGYSAYFSPGKKDDKNGDANKARRTALVKVLEKIVFEFPDDLEAKAFLVFQVWDNAQHGMPISSHTALAALAGEVLAKNPMHPGAHHYLIHLWNHQDDRRALKSAAVGGQAAPGVAHLWHMPGHTFTALKRYGEAAWQQEASARTDHAFMIETRLMPEQIHNYAHNNDWLVENLGYIGRVSDAIDLAKNMIELPRIGPRTATGGKPSHGGFKMGRDRLTAALIAWERWDELLALDGGAYMPPLDDTNEEAERLRLTGTAAFLTGNKALGEAKTDAIRTWLENVKAERAKKSAEAEAAAKKANKPEDKMAKAVTDAQAPFKAKMEPFEKAVAELEFFRALAEGRTDDARKQIGTVNSAGKVRLSRLNDLAGDSAKAAQIAREAVKEGNGQVLPLANLADILWRKGSNRGADNLVGILNFADMIWRAGSRQEALDTFQKLRPLCAQADLDQPVFQRLRAVADELNLPADWRPKLNWPADSGQRPDIASLGPFRWHPYAAPDWSLPDQTGEMRRFSQSKGKPTLMIFYLGSGCSHCIEQLNAFGPMTKDFTDAGINLLAVSTEKSDELFKTYALAKAADGFPFPILADPTLATFKAYRAYDDFETMPLHGTFLIDADGLVRWQDISYQPFTNAKWLLAESKRLLALPRAVTAKALTSNLPAQ